MTVSCHVQPARVKVLGARCTVRRAVSRAVQGAVVALLVLVAESSGHSQGRIANATLETQAVAGTLERTIDAVAARGGSAWIGYRTPMIPGPRQMCCSDSVASSNDCCGMCRLESGGGVTMTQSSSADTRGSRIVLEAPTDVIVLARVENRAITRIRMFTPDCDLDGGGMTVVWLESVSPAASVAWLAGLARSSGDRDRAARIVRPAIAALAVHPDRTALTTLIDLARNDPRRETRTQALFWLSQRAGQEAVSAIKDALQNDPETEVKRRAVFALSQLPKDEGIPLLIEVARSNRNPEVRKQAMFWLGQSHDPRAVQFFEEVLNVK